MRNTDGQGALYTTWFGTHDIVSQSVVATTFELMSSNQFNTFTYNCGASAPDCTDPDDVAYVEPEVRATLPTVNGATDAIVYGAQESLSLALRDPARAASNACNYE
ncbi:hypothetical protein GSI_02488 [Ganoderma sinense ZZ0214-1]|uniref:Lysine-specific metallo-endopeptidase domain-containing protein n=1 Tax=Ganoderma sinense ZZ0214-1 TaxID=1077348 RepID=A0A2G8SQB1_9APHY|nr:hypothetical protein GSI_02488 [Ganoderma sinense ZZ0214-1]